MTTGAMLFAEPLMPWRVENKKVHNKADEAHPEQLP